MKKEMSGADSLVEKPDKPTVEAGGEKNEKTVTS